MSRDESPPLVPLAFQEVGLSVAELAHLGLPLTVFTVERERNTERQPIERRVPPSAKEPPPPVHRARLRMGDTAAG